LDNPSVGTEQLLAVVAERNETHIGSLDEAGRLTLKDRLYTAGELLRMNQLQPSEEARQLTPENLELFSGLDLAS
jgi:hypothetical protein